MAKIPKAPIGFNNISTTYQVAFETYDGNVQVRKISDHLWEILPRGGGSFFETARPEALERALQIAASRTASSFDKGDARWLLEAKKARMGRR